ncbi:uncharacterized protein [Cherax quadricarinatus]
MTGVLVKTCLLGALALTLLHSGAQAQCDNVEIINEWEDNYQADFNAPAPIDIEDLSVEMTFSRPVDEIVNYSGDVTKIDDYHFILTFPGVNLNAGDNIMYRFQVVYPSFLPLVVTEVVNGVEICDAVIVTPPPLENPCAETGMQPYDYSQVLCMSYLFYEAQRSGKLPADQRITWRGDSALDDGSDVGHDLSGGYYDAGDRVKFGFPMAFTATMLAWGLIDFAEGYEIAGQTEYGQVGVKWATDYFLKAYTAKNEFYGQVGKGDIDHNSNAGRPEDMTMERPSYKIDEEHPGSELAGETAAALAAASIVFKEVDPSYSEKLLATAKELYDFADNFRQNYDVSIEDAYYYYHSYSGYGDELCWAALWLARATGDNAYLTRAREHWDEFDLGAYGSSIGWDGKIGGADSLFYLLTGESQYSDLINQYLNWLQNEAPYTPEGLVYLVDWGSNRDAANACFLTLWAAKHGLNTEVNQEWARGQIGQLLGDNPRYQSFVVGYGVNPPVRPCHGSSACPNPPEDCTGSFNNPGPNPHTLFGALVGGPDADGNYNDNRTDWQHNEVACDYNAGFTGSLAALVEISN